MGPGTVKVLNNAANTDTAQLQNSAKENGQKGYMLKHC